MTAIGLRGGAAMLVGQWAKLLAQLAGLAILSRLVVPEEFGKFAMIIAIAGIAAIFSDFGLSIAAVRAKNLSDGESANLFWLNSLIGACVAATFYLAAPLVAYYYREPALVASVQTLAAVFVLNGIAVQPKALLNRDLKFRVLAFLEGGGPLIGVVVAIVLALYGAGVGALVAQQLVSAAFIALLSLVLSSWRPAMPTMRVSIRAYLSFGAATSLTQGINYLSSNTDSLVLGRLWGPLVLGVYSRAYQISALPLQQLAAPLTRVVVPILSQTQDGCSYRHLIGRANLLICYAMTWLLALLTATAEPMVGIVLGPTWSSSAIYLQILAVGGVFQVLGYVYYWACLAQGRMKLLLVCEGAGRAVMIALIVAAGFVSPVWVAVAYSSGLAVVWTFTAFIGGPRLQLPVMAMTRASLRPLIPAFCYIVVGVVAQQVLEAQGFSRILQLVIVGTLAVATIMLAACHKTVRQDYRFLQRSVAKIVANRSRQDS